MERIYKYNYYTLVLREENIAEVYGAYDNKQDAQKQVDILKKQEIHKDKEFLIMGKEKIEDSGLMLV